MDAVCYLTKWSRLKLLGGWTPQLFVVAHGIYKIDKHRLSREADNLCGGRGHWICLTQGFRAPKLAVALSIVGSRWPGAWVNGDGGRLCGVRWCGVRCSV